MGTELLIVGLIAFMLIAALIAVEAADLLSSVIAVGAAGLALSVVDLLLGAPDLAITQVVVETIAVVLLIRVVLTRRDTTGTASRDMLRTGVALLAAGLILAATFFAFGGGNGGGAGTVPEFGKPVMTHAETKDLPPGADKKAHVPPGVGKKYLEKAKDDTGATNVVTAVLLDIRAYDTLGEATVIFVSILGVYIIIRRVGRTSRRGELAKDGKGPDSGPDPGEEVGA